MEGMRELLRGNLRRSLQAMKETDRLAAAWPVVCGVAMAAHGEIVGYEDGIVSFEVSDDGWMRQMISMQGQIGGELGRIAGVRVTGVHFEKKKTAFRDRESRR
jgi:hypothetical protein